MYMTRYLSGLQTVTVRFMNIQRVQAVCTRQVKPAIKSCSPGLNAPTYLLNRDGRFEFTIILWIHLVILILLQT